MNCPKCGKELENESVFCPACGSPVKDESEITEIEKSQEVEKPREMVLDETVKPTKKKMSKKNLIILAIVAVVALAGIGFGVKSYMDNKAREEYVAQYNQYVDDIDSMKLEMLTGGANAEKVCNLTLKVWSNAIWKKSSAETDKYTKSGGAFVSDFNTALTNLTKDQTVMNSRVDLSVRIDKVSEKMDKMKNPPEELMDKYETLKEMFSSFQDFLNAAISPSGSYSSYNRDMSSLDSEFMRQYKKVDAFDLKHITK